MNTKETRKTASEARRKILAAIKDRIAMRKSARADNAQKAQKAQSGKAVKK